MQQIPDFIDLPEDKQSATITPIELFSQLLELDIKEKERVINFIASSMDLKTIPEAKKITGKSYNGLKKFGNVVKLIGRNYIVI